MYHHSLLISDCNIVSYHPIITPIEFEGYHIGVLRLDLMHPVISGNKWFKLKYNIETALRLQKKHIITFGGAHSNHIAACAGACKQYGIDCTGFIRADTKEAVSPTLQAAKQAGMQLEFLDRGQYKQKQDAGFLSSLALRFPDAYIIPEGGDNEAGIRGCMEILGPYTNDYKHIACAVGTGTTFKGLERSLELYQYLNGIVVLKGWPEYTSDRSRYITDHHFGGYAKHTNDLIDFKDRFESAYHIPLDYIYTAKLAYTIFDLIKKGYYPKQEKILMIHSGGLQGNPAYETRYNLKPKRQLMDPQG